MARQNLLRCSIALVGMVVAAAAFGAQPAATPVAPVKPSSAATAGAPDLICRNRLRPGSHIAMRTCLTAAQWAAARIQWANSGVQDGAGPWGGGAVSTVGASVGMSAFTAR